MRIPDEITHVHGCTCGGLLHHRYSEPRCALLDQDRETAEAAVADAEQRVQAWVDEQNRRLRETGVVEP